MFEGPWGRDPECGEVGLYCLKFLERERQARFRLGETCLTLVSGWVNTSQMALVVKNLPAHAGDIRDAGSIFGWGRCPRGGMATHSSILAWEVPWTEESGGLQSMMGSQRDRPD